ncbi:MAG TPA: alpha/beta fold hydrolase [Ktedonobacterales bacterium]|nr:alpha/beta fold hydrolase [Ktedonobacterales bacterium]
MEIEQRVQVAIDNWAPRFLANGIDPNDFQRVTKRVTRWDDWSPEWSACGAMHEQMGQEAEAARCYESAGDHYLHAAMCYHFGKFMFVHKPDVLRAAHARVAQTYQKGLPYYEYPGERVAIPYEGGKTLYGILRKPWHRPKPPIVILSPGLDSVKEELHFYGDDFLRRGMAVLAVDGPGQGEAELEHALRHDAEVPMRAVIDALERRTDIDTGRIGMMGVSLGGYFATRAAAFEPRIKAVICLAAGYNLARHFDRYPILTQEAFIYRLKAPDEASARERLKQFDLQGVMARVTCPLLVVMGRLDRLFPAEDAERMAAEAGGPTDLWMFDDGNHVCNNIPYKYRPQQADWMRSKLER